MLSHIAHWITHSDGKTGILAAALIAVLAGVSIQFDAIIAVLRSGILGYFMGIVLAAWAVSAVAVSWNVDRALRPQVTRNNEFNAYSWPDIASVDVPNAHLLERDDAVMVSEQVRRLSVAASFKFRHFRLALSFGWLFLSSSFVIVVLIAVAEVF